jgi:MFS family permease
MIARLASNKAILDQILMIVLLAYALGGVWSPVLGYLLLDMIGWRVYIILTSLPLFIPPMFMLHFCFEETMETETQEERDEILPKEINKTVSNYVARTTKIGMFSATSNFLGWMTILLVPNLIQMFKIKEAEPNSDCSVTATHGSELLFLGLVTFAAILGRLTMHYTRKKISFRKLQVVVALFNMGCFVGMLTMESLAVAVAINFLVKYLFGIAAMAACYINFDENYYGTSGFALGSSITEFAGTIGGVIGTALVAFAPRFYTMISALVVSAIQMVMVLLMTEVQL